MPIPLEDSNVVRQARSLSGTSAQSAAFAATTRMLRLCSDTSCYYTLGTAPLAATTDTLLPAGVVDWVAVPVGQSYKIAART